MRAPSRIAAELGYKRAMATGPNDRVIGRHGTDSVRLGRRHHGPDMHSRWIKMVRYGRFGWRGNHLRGFGSRRFMRWLIYRVLDPRIGFNSLYSGGQGHMEYVAAGDIRRQLHLMSRLARGRERNCGRPDFSRTREGTLFPMHGRRDTPMHKNIAVVKVG